MPRACLCHARGKPGGDNEEKLLTKKVFIKICLLDRDAIDIPIALTP